ncbi:CD109 antigen-like [Pollicipes pollicipes]|uniref:CD109 antigen-like n=1 Tax=Pollicipes pollicipes TaxID=41117 RepID=UPI001884F549|nr:CD109 antigen-like [Pollicipes pollicipes]XP_037068260.1 CD109 antigen-like [Pollicipes pollicipes]XP_037068262.1 CD109 antigen-like [Pollicipes pollicipes]XP_037068263.1 CD109 antigen-like [Pollicipes pollicipes]XP_037068264.1 CD109 antigen-like [Pollicipes pollicipes]XP_037068265.1 CD109 antigen-like [Pollicipes pollicipes]
MATRGTCWWRRAWYGPGTIYRALAALLTPAGSALTDRLRYPLTVRASLLRDGVELASSIKTMTRGDIQMMMMKVPSTSVRGDYRLRLEGDHQGSVGGTVFFNETRLQFAQRFLTVLIQTSRPLYTFGQFVRFRIVMLRTDLKPFDDPVDVYVLDSDGYIMRRWPSQSSNNGVVALSFKLPGIGKGGWWRIRVSVRGQIEEKFMRLTKVRSQQWEVFVWTPTYFLLSGENITGEFSAGYTNDKNVRGNATLELWVRTGSPLTERDKEYTFVASQTFTQFDGGDSFSFPMAALQGTVPRLNEAEVKIITRVNDYWLNQTQVGFCNSKLINSSVSIQFLGAAPQLYKPGMPFKGQVLVTYHDQAPLSPETLRLSTLTISSSGDTAGGVRIPSEAEVAQQAAWRNGTLWLPARGERRLGEARHLLPDAEREYLAALRDDYLRRHEWAEYRASGLHRFELATPPRGGPLQLTATFSAADGVTAAASLALQPYYSLGRNMISVSTSNRRTDVGQYAVFHVRSNFPMSYFYLIVVSKNLVIHGDRVPVRDASGPAVTTTSLPVSAEMAPSFRLLVYHVTSQGVVVTDAVQVPVEGINRGRTKLVLNQHKDHSKNTMELGMWSTPGATFCTTSNRAYLYSVQAGHDLSRTSVLSSLHSFENTTRSIHRALWRWRDGSRPMQTEYYVTPDYGIDANTSFDLASLVVFTDARVYSAPGTECGEGELRCLIRGCYNATKSCDGVNDCPDGADEAGCWSDVSNEESERRFRLRRRSTFNDIFDIGDGDWAWLLKNIGHEGGEQQVLDVPETNDDWYINGFSISQKDGFGLVEEPLHYVSNRPFYMTMELVSQIRRGETISARLLLVNNQQIEVLALVVLPSSPNYEFVHVEQHGVISHKNVRTSSGDHQHLVPVSAEGSVEVTVPIKPLVELGDLEVTLKCITQFGLDVESATVSVQAEGVQTGGHTSFLLDLKNRAVDHKFLNIMTEQSPEVPYATWRRFVYGSVQGSVMVSGDVIGPIFPESFMTSSSVFGKPLKCLDGTVFNLAYNAWSLHYMRLTNQLTRAFLRSVLEKMNVQFILIMKRYRRGPFLFYDGGRPSVWGTAWAVRQLQYSQFQDWENYLYVEPRILSEAAEWLCLFQNADGSFNETKWYVYPLDQKMDPRSKIPGEGDRKRRVPLTAHVLITLHAVQEKLQGGAKASVATAKIRAMQYLERSLSVLTDAYEVAITAYALTLCNSVDREVAFSKLHVARREVEGMYYWARAPLATLDVSRDVNQRPYLEPKSETLWDAQGVEATSYALLVYLLRDGVGIDQEKMVLWLNSMRQYNGAWISTVDTIVAMQALTEYSFRARLRDITDMQVTIESSGLRDFQRVVQIGNTTAGQVRTVDLPNVWGHVNVVGTGAGQAVVQLDVSYGFDRENLKDTPPVKSFELLVRENAVQEARNKSIIHVEACYRWMHTEESDVSGTTILEVELPSGYRIDQHVANADVRRNKRNPNNTLMSAKSDTDKVYWYIDRVYSNFTQCFNWTIYRRYLVANYTAYRSARMYEYFAPERFEMQILNSTELNVVDVCQVCGSYQCPYCPWYSGAAARVPGALVVALAVHQVAILALDLT